MANENENAGGPQTPAPQRDYSRYDVNIQGKTYRTVAGRIREFWDLAADNGSGETPETFAAIDTECTWATAADGREVIRCKATAYLGNKRATGHASEVFGDGNINTDSAVENCETSAVGRALGNLGLGLISAGGVASANEVQGAVAKQAAAPYAVATAAQVNLVRTLVAKLALNQAEVAAIREKLGVADGAELTKAQASAYIQELKDREAFLSDPTR